MSERASCNRCGDFVEGEEAVCSACVERAHELRRNEMRGELALRRLSGHFYLLGILAGLMTALIALASWGTRFSFVALAGGATVCFAAFGLGRGVATLRRWSLWGARVLGVLLLFVFPLGTLLGLEALYVTARHGELTSDEYREVVDLTPALDEKPIPVWQWVVIALLVAAIPGWFLIRSAWVD